MEWSVRAAVCLQLVSELRERGSWCGETHLQKAMYFLKDQLGAEGLYEFILYKHGPFSFDLRDDLATFRARQLLELVIQAPPYGPRITPTESGAKHLENSLPVVEKFSSPISRVAAFLHSRGVVDLERLATALYVRREMGQEADSSVLTQRIIDLKPHVPEAAASAAVAEVDGFLNAPN